jgi:hypothetical protein
MTMPSAHSADVEFLPRLDILRPERQRRWTVLLRGFLLIPHYVWLSVLGIAAAVVVVLSWWAALFLGRLPYWSATFLSGYLAYAIRVNGYGYLFVDRYPPFRWQEPEYPIDIALRPGRLNRLAVLFRVILVIPAAIVTEVLAAGWAALAVIIWLIVLILGRMPLTVFTAGAASYRYVFRTQAYLMLLTSAYPKMLFGDVDEPRDPSGRHSDTAPLLLSSGARTLLIVALVLGVLGEFGGTTTTRLPQNTTITTAGH